MSNINNFVTIGYLKNFTKGVVKINSDGSLLSNDYIVSYDEIVSGKYFPYFKDNELSPKSIISGLYVPYKDNTSDYVKVEDMQVIFPKMMSLMIQCEDVFISPCGGSVDLHTMVNVNLMVRGYEGETVIRKMSYEVNPILRKNEDDFKLEKHTISVDSNIGKDARTTIVTASYSFRSTIKNASIEIIQKPNEETNWIFDNNTTNSISLSASETVLPSEGGKTILTVTREYTSNYYKEDSCGNKIAFSSVTRKP